MAISGGRGEYCGEEGRNGNVMRCHFLGGFGVFGSLGLGVGCEVDVPML